MVNMTVKQALDYIVRGNGIKYTKDTYDKIQNFIEMLPQYPLDKEFLGKYEISGVECDEYIIYDYVDLWQYVICDYEQGWYCKLQFGKTYMNKIVVDIVDTDMLDPNENENRVKTNEEALQVMKELKEIKRAEDIDKWWRMSDDPSVSRWGYETNRKADTEERKLLAKLR